MASQDQPAVDTTTQPRHTAHIGPAVGTADDALIVPTMQLQPPWHVRHARALLAGVGAAVAAGVGYGAFYVSQLASDPLSNLTSLRAPAVQGAIALPAKPAPPVAAPAPAPRAAIKPAPVKAVVAPARPQAVRPAPPAEPRPAPVASAHRPVTHTQPAEPAQIPTAQNRASAARSCSEAIAALGLCSAVPGGEQK